MINVMIYYKNKRLANMPLIQIQIPRIGESIDLAKIGKYRVKDVLHEPFSGLGGVIRLNVDKI